MKAWSKIVYQIVDRQTGQRQGVYSRACHDEFEWDSPESALHANCHGIHKDSDRYAIQKVIVTREVVDPDVAWRPAGGGV